MRICEFIDNFKEKNKLKNYLEIGTREGESLTKVIVNNSNIETILISDIWGCDYGGTNKGNHNHISYLLNQLNFTGNVVFLDGDSKETIPKIRDKYIDFFDLILVDGDHSYEGGMTDLVNVFDLCKSGGTIIFDDISHSNHKYLEECFDVFVENNSDKIDSSYKIYDDCGMGILIKK